VERVVAVQNPAAPGGVAGELQRRLDRLGAAVSEVDALQVRRLGHQLLGEHPGQWWGIELGQIGQPEVEDVVQGPPDRRVMPAQREHTEAGKHVEVLVAAGVVQICAFTAHVDLVKADRVQRAVQLGVAMTLVQCISLAAAAREQITEKRLAVALVHSASEVLVCTVPTGSDI